MTKGENMMHTKAEREALLAAQPERQRTSHQGRKLRYEEPASPARTARHRQRFAQAAW